MGKELATVEQAGALARADEGLAVEALVARVEKIKQVSERVMVEGRHYGTIPGVKKPSLLKPGAEILCLTFQLAPTFKLQEKRAGDHLEVIATCTLKHAPSGAVVGSAVGSCTTRESKYAYRKAERICPKCGKEAIIKGQDQFGGGWVCWKKKDGCGAKFDDGDQAIEGQSVGRVDNPDLPDTHNTVRKMASKRALVAAVLIVTCASDLFTQDVEEGSVAPEPGASRGAKPQAVASDKEVDELLKAIASCASFDDLAEVQATTRSRGLKFSPSAQKALNAAHTAKHRELDSEDENARFG